MVWNLPYRELGGNGEGYGMGADRAGQRQPDGETTTEVRHRLLLGAMDEGYARYAPVAGPDGTPADMIVLEVNAAYERLLGRHHPVGKRLRELVPALEQEWLEAMTAVARAGTAQRFERYNAALDRWFDVAVIPLPSENPDSPDNEIALLFRDITERKRTEASAARAERRAEGILERMGDAHCVLDRDFHIESVNAATERLLGRSRATLLGRSHWEAFPASVDAPIGQAFRRVVAEGLEQHLTHHYTGEGYDLHLEVDAYPTDEGGVAMFWRDVTERVRAEAELRASETKFRTLFETMDEGFVIAEMVLDAAGRPADARYLEGNPAASRLTGMSDFNGRLWSELMPGAEQEWLEIYDRVARTGVAERLERYAAPLGRWYDFRVSRAGAPPGGTPRVAVLFADVTQRKLTEEALRESEERQAFLLRLSDAVRFLDDPAAVQAVAARLLGEHLGVDRAMYAEIGDGGDPDAGVVRGQYVLPGVAPFLERYSYAALVQGALGEALQAGEPLIVADAVSDPRLGDDERSAWLDAGIRSLVAQALAKGGRVVAIFGFHHGAPRAWTETEVALVREVGERTWDAAERVRAEAALRDSEEKYRVLFESIDGGFCIIEMLFDEHGQAIDYVFLETNPVFEQQAGFKAAPGQRMREIAPEHEKHWFDIYGRIALTGEPARFEHQAASFGIVYDVYAFRVDEPERRRVAVLFRNITERRRAEEALRESEQLRRIALDSGGMGAWTWDTQARTMRADDAVQSLWGVSTSDHPHAVSLYANLMYPAGRAWLESVMAREIAPGEEVHTQVQVASGPTSSRWVQLRGRADPAKPWIINGVSFDITEQRLAEQKLRESEERLQLALGAAALGTSVWYPQENRAEPDARFLSLFGCDSGDPINRTDVLTEMIYPDDRALYAELVAGALDPGGPGRLRAEIRIVHPDGSPRWVAVSGQTVFDGTPPRAVRMDSTAQDITEQKRREANRELLVDIVGDLGRLGAEEQIVQTVGGKLATHLGLTCYHYVDVDEHRGEVTVRFFWHALDVPDIRGTYPIAGFVPAYGLERFRAGEALVVSDVESDISGQDAASAGLRAGAAAQKIGAYVAVPFSQDGRWKAYFAVADSSPRRWTSPEIELIQEVASAVFPRIERVRAEAALREKDTDLSLALQAANAGLSTLDLATGRGTTTPEWSAVVGLPPGPTVQPLAAFLALVHPDDRARVAALHAEAAAQRSGLEFEFRVDHPAKGERWLLSRSRYLATPEDGPGRLIGIAMDITDRRRAEAALRDSEERYRLIVERAIDYAIFTADADGRIETWPPGAETVFGWSAEEAVGQPTAITFTPEDRAAGVPAREIAAARAEGRAPNVRWHEQKDGRRVFIEGATYARRGPDGAFRGVFKVGQDVTERRRAEEALRESEASLKVRVDEATTELRALSRRLLLVQEEERRHLARELHDEIGGSLTGLRLQLSAARGKSGPAALDDAEATVERLTDQVRQRSMDLRPQTLDVFGLATALETLVRDLERRTGLLVALDLVGLDGDRLAPELEITAYRIVQEALTNVVRHAGVLTASVHLWRDGELALLIRDAGLGFDEDSLPRLNGLRGMQERAELLGGVLTVQSAPGFGTTISAVLPITLPLDATAGEGDATGAARLVTARE